jgi:hypothetical protein
MGKIKMPPNDIEYPRPKAVGNGKMFAEIIGRAMIQETCPEWGDYMRILDLLLWEDGDKEIRFCYYYRKPNGTDSDWIFGQGSGHMKVYTFYKLIHKAATEPDHGNFEGIFDEFVDTRT